MNWEAAGAVGEIVGAFAVVLTLIYLAIQIRHSIRATKALVRESATNSMVQDIRATYQDKDLLSAYVKLQNGESLSNTEEYCVRQESAAWLRTYENMHYQYRKGFLDEEEWQGHLHILKLVFQPNPGPGEAKGITDRFDSWPGVYSSEFQELIGAIRAEHEFNRRPQASHNQADA